MKKYKIYWSLFALFNETQSEVVRLQTLFKTLIATPVIGSVWYSSSSNNTLYVALVCGVVDMLLGCFYFKEIKETEVK